MIKEIERLRTLEIYQMAAEQGFVDHGNYRFICMTYDSTLMFYRVPKRYLGTILVFDSAWLIAQYEIDDFVQDLKEAGLLSD